MLRVEASADGKPLLPIREQVVRKLLEDPNGFRIRSAVQNVRRARVCNHSNMRASKTSDATALCLTRRPFIALRAHGAQSRR